ncbi:type II toxin-antitoxin system YafQ family toxin [Variovorax sp. H27-G14]|uniref:type II toxin-antitoxin system YafQ family toxin n=1 Tax=Variovorax sp. H27-G14 TaxID=3111914 RepID=UPI0038FCB2BB
MPSKAPQKKKHASLPKSSSFTRQFHKDWTRLSHSGRHDMNRPKEAMLLLLANDGPLPAEWFDHELQGEWADHRECHVKGDLLLIYQVAGEHITFVRLGTHAELFE